MVNFVYEIQLYRLGRGMDPKVVVVPNPDLTVEVWLMDGSFRGDHNHRLHTVSETCQQRLFRTSD
jgi:hypothetical protein